MFYGFLSLKKAGKTNIFQTMAAGELRKKNHLKACQKLHKN